MAGFIGRDAELELLARLTASDHPLVTIVGPPGVGKTRLAREHMARAKRVVCVELGDAATGADICARLAGALGFVLSASHAEAADEVGERLAARPGILVVLDNFEQLVDHADDTVGRWAIIAPDVRLLVTSRVALGLDHEHVVELQPLRLPPAGGATSDATEMFLACAARARPELDLGTAEREHIADVCRVLDGLPLALELAAARLGVLSAGDLLERIRRSLALVSGGESPRHASLAAAIEMSWDGLSAEARNMLAQCSVFRGGFTADAAEYVVRHDRPEVITVDVLQELRRSSLLSVEQNASGTGLRCAMLLSVRSFAASRLAERHASVRERHTEYFVTTGREHAARAERGAVESAGWLEAEQGNIRAVYERAHEATPTAQTCEIALDCLIALDPVARSYDARLVSMLSEAIARARSHDLAGETLLRARILYGDHLRSRGRLDDSHDELVRVRDTLRGADMPSLYAECLQRLGTIHLNRERFDDASALYEQAIEAAQACGDRVVEARAITRLAAIAGMRGEYAGCERLYRKAVVILRDEGDTLWLGRTYYWMGIMFLGHREYAEARHYLDNASELLASARDHRFRAGVLLELAISAQEDGDYDRALEQYGRATRALRDCGERRGVCEAIGFWASCFFESGDLESARSHFDEAIAVGREVDNERHVGLFAGYLAGLDAAEGHSAAAALGFDSAEALLRRLKATEWLGTVELLRALESVHAARHAARTGQLDVAEQARAEAVERLNRARQPRGAGPPLLDVSSEARISARIVEKALLGSTALARDSSSETVSGSALVVTYSGTKLRAPGQGWTPLPKRSPLRRLLNTLVTRRQNRPGDAVSLDELVEAGWPDEKMLSDAGRNRAYMALSRLRKLGLKPVLRRSDTGYFLDPEIELIRVPEP